MIDLKEIEIALEKYYDEDSSFDNNMHSFYENLKENPKFYSLSAAKEQKRDQLCPVRDKNCSQIPEHGGFSISNHYSKALGDVVDALREIIGLLYEASDDGFRINSIRSHVMREIAVILKTVLHGAKFKDDEFSYEQGIVQEDLLKNAKKLLKIADEQIGTLEAYEPEMPELFYDVAKLVYQTLYVLSSEIIQNDGRDNAFDSRNLSKILDKLSTVVRRGFYQDILGEGKDILYTPELPDADLIDKAIQYERERTRSSDLEALYDMVVANLDANPNFYDFLEDGVKTEKVGVFKNRKFVGFSDREEDLMALKEVSARAASVGLNFMKNAQMLGDLNTTMPFSHLFGSLTRIVVDLPAEYTGEMKEIIEFYQDNGWKLDLDAGRAYREYSYKIPKGPKAGETILRKDDMSIGKLISKHARLTERLWDKQVNLTQYAMTIIPDTNYENMIIMLDRYLTGIPTADAYHKDKKLRELADIFNDAYYECKKVFENFPQKNNVIKGHYLFKKFADGTKAREWMSWWNKNSEEFLANPDFGSKKNKMIVSRHPMDVMRMSDFPGMDSCHAEKYSGNVQYFYCALVEAQGLGAIAYFIDEREYNKYFEKRDIDNPHEPNSPFQTNEIFSDYERGISGMNPLSRIRIRRFLDWESGFDIGMPDLSSYGQIVPYARKTLKDWLYSNQIANIIQNEGYDTEEELADGKIDPDRFTLTGAEYIDSNLDRVWVSFFDDDHYEGIQISLEDEEFNQEMKDFVEAGNFQEVMNKIDSQIEALENFNIHYEVEYENHTYFPIVQSVTFDLEFDTLYTDFDLEEFDESLADNHYEWEDLFREWFGVRFDNIFPHPEAYIDFDYTDWAFRIELGPPEIGADWGEFENYVEKLDTFQDHTMDKSFIPSFIKEAIVRGLVQMDPASEMKSILDFISKRDIDYLHVYEDKEGYHFQKTLYVGEIINTPYSATAYNSLLTWIRRAISRYDDYFSAQHAADQTNLLETKTIVYSDRKIKCSFIHTMDLSFHGKRQDYDIVPNQAYSQKKTGGFVKILPDSYEYIKMTEDAIKSTEGDTPKTLPLFVTVDVILNDRHFASYGKYEAAEKIKIIKHLDSDKCQMVKKILNKNLTKFNENQISSIKKDLARRDDITRENLPELFQNAETDKEKAFYLKIILLSGLNIFNEISSMGGGAVAGAMGPGFDPDPKRKKRHEKSLIGEQEERDWKIFEDYEDYFRNLPQELSEEGKAPASFWKNPNEFWVGAVFKNEEFDEFMLDPDFEFVTDQYETVEVADNEIIQIQPYNHLEGDKRFAEVRADYELSMVHAFSPYKGSGYSIFYNGIERYKKSFYAAWEMFYDENGYLHHDSLPAKIHYMTPEFKKVQDHLWYNHGESVCIVDFHNDREVFLYLTVNEREESLIDYDPQSRQIRHFVPGGLYLNRPRIKYENGMPLKIVKGVGYKEEQIPLEWYINTYGPLPKYQELKQIVRKYYYQK